jgi:hypothetical protein
MLWLINIKIQGFWAEKFNFVIKIKSEAAGTVLIFRFQNPGIETTHQIIILRTNMHYPDCK